jgi:hypothetical protein
MYMPAWLLATPLPGFWKRKRKMKTQQRRDAAMVAADFRDQLVKLVDEALADHAKNYFLVEALDAQIVRLRMQAASRPW